ncbi:MAG: 3-isopropylmalate dehydratase small subunit [Clostridia bacterium]|nr:3-isopropylmalate dehydratase small subunit [Clostridia bacterium]
MIIQGKCHTFGNDIDTDVIIPARYLNTSDPQELARHCMEDLDPGFAGRVQQGDIIAAGKNFGCGSSREHAPLAIKAAGVRAVIAASFARIFYRNAINIGLPIFESAAAAAGIQAGDEVKIDAEQGVIVNLTRGESYEVTPLPPFIQEIIAAGGLMPWVARKVNRDV